MKDFEEKLEQIRPIRSTNSIRAGKEWNQVSFYIKDKMIGREKYKQASEQKDRMKIHIVEMFDQLGMLTYYETSTIIHRFFSDVFSTDHLEMATKQDIELSSDSDKVRFFLRGVEVAICWCPSITETKKQALLPFDDYTRLIKTKDTSGENVFIKKSAFTFEDVARSAFEKGTSDIQVTFSESVYTVFFEINGSLVPQNEFLMSSEDGFDFLVAVKNAAAKFTKGDFKADYHNAPQDAKVSYPNIGSDGIDVRLAFIPDGNMSAMSITGRILKREKLSEPNFKAMGYDDELIEKINTLSKRQNGLVLSSGITGSGKSTFIANMVVGIDQTKRVFTIEDPIEYFIPNSNVTQHQVYIPEDESKRVGFKELAKAMKRAAPKVVNIGEMRNDRELIDSVFEMSEAGQLVLSTLHISSAFSIYESLEQIFKVEPNISIPVILFSINQVLVSKLCPHCKKEDTHNTNISLLEKNKDDLPYQHLSSLSSLIEEAKNENVVLYRRGDGCQHCGNSGYSGRVPIYEYFSPNVKFKEWLKSHSNGLPSRYAIEEKACELEIGVNKIDTLCRRLREGVIDASEEVIFKIM